MVENEVVENQEGVVVETTVETVKETETKKSSKVVESILQLLADGSKVQSELVKSINTQPSSVNQSLKKLITQGKVKREKPEVEGQKKVFVYSLTGV